jgi:hypothetical protein
MAEDKKPKIDLKSRLQKMGPAAATPPPVAVAPVPPPSASRPPPAMPIPPPSVPPPSGIPRPPVGVQSAAALDPNNPLAAVAQGFRPSSRPAAPALPQAQRIEVDEGAVQQARSGARKQGLVIGLVIAAALGGLGWVGGNASNQSAGRAQGVQSAHDLAGDLVKAKASLDQIKDALTKGADQLRNEKKFPADLANNLRGMNVDFGGDKLAGRRFSGVSTTDMHDLVDFITRVQALNDKKDLVVSLLSHLQKPIEEELKGVSPIRLVMLFDDSVDTNGTYILPLVTPIPPDPNIPLPATLKFTNPKGGTSELPRLADTKKIPSGGALVPVVPPSFNAVCPSLAKGQIGQLVASMNTVIGDITGQKAEDASEDAKPGLSDIAAKLSDDLTKVN